MEPTPLTRRTPERARWLLLGAAAALLLAAARPSAAAEPSPPSRPASAGEQVAALWRDLGPNLATTLTAGRRLLLGHRDPNVKTCVSPDRPTTLSYDARGGPGSRLAYQWYITASKRRSAAEDFAWQQTTLRAVLQEMAKQSEQVLPQAIRLAETAERLARALRQDTVGPVALSPSPAARDTWPGCCADGLVSALRGNQLGAARRWADELASALAALADLHRWLDYLVRSHLTALDFQARYKSLYESCNVTYPDTAPFDPLLSCLPAGEAGCAALRNLMEVEHQAEWLFKVASDRLVRRLDGELAANANGADAVPAAGHMPQHLRSAFIRLRGVLSPAAQRLWDTAAGSPFDRSYLANMLYRITVAGALEQVAVVLARYDRAYRPPTQQGLMDVIFYRAGSPHAAAKDWAERFDPRLMDAAATLGGSDEQVILGAQHFARALLGTATHYGGAHSLREALDTQKFDCINGTNIIGALYRNAGRAGFYSIRWSGGTVGHTVAAAEVSRPGGPAIVIVDALEDAQTATDLWPHAYARGHRWPPAYPGARAAVHAVELYARGLDSYVWTEGYIVRGPDAGTLVRTSVPYLPTRSQTGALRVQQWPVPNSLSPNNG